METREKPGPEAGPTEEGEGERPVAPVRRRARTAALIAAAAALGIVAGGCVGYVVQAGRVPTKLPPLSQPVLRQGKGAVPVLTAAEDRQVRTDGDLRKLLLPKPRGARGSVLAEGTDGWLDLAGYAGDFQDPAAAFQNQLVDEFRRAAVTSWQADGGYDIEIRLVQYRQETKMAAHEEADHEQYWASIEPDTEDLSVPGTGDGMAYTHHRPQAEAGHRSSYLGEAIASRGGILMEIWVYGSKPVPMKTVMDLAKRQVGRL
ncbi:hypothetical protein [Streptomyces sp. AM6-12]|uniref:hypothetical protein n=1 Tax=Streptomyces sp. AM6-12 TaxID=3345149 RepID=UPI0037B59A24